jgi:hypothetical protein
MGITEPLQGVLDPVPTKIKRAVFGENSAPLLISRVNSQGLVHSFATATEWTSPWLEGLLSPFFYFVFRLFWATE